MECEIREGKLYSSETDNATVIAFSMNELIIFETCTEIELD